MRLGYGKLGRSHPLTLTNASNIGGDMEVVRLLNILRKEHEVHLIGRNRVDTQLENVVNHWAPGGAFGTINAEAYVRNENRGQHDPKFQLFRKLLLEGIEKLPPLDAVVCWLGQHGSSSGFIPPVKKSQSDEFTTPLMSSLNYSYPLALIFNKLKIRPIFLCPDPRNKLKLRDIAEPKQRVVLAQYDTWRDNLFYDAGPNACRQARVEYRYAGIELLAVNRAYTPAQLDVAPLPTRNFGVLVNEGPTNVKKNRADLVVSWLRGLDFEIFGHWSDSGMQKIGRVVTPVPVSDVFKTLRRWRSTITFPASNTGWSTSKPWEAFAAGCVCFRHPDYDDQDHIYGRHMPEELRAFLSPPTVTGLHTRVEAMKEDRMYTRIADMQNRYFWDSMDRLRGGTAMLREELEVVVAEQALA